MKNRMNHAISNTLVICVIVVFFTSFGFAQENPIYRLSDDGSQNQSRSAGVITNYPEDLLYDLQSSIYIKDNAVLSVYGNTPPKVLKIKDVQSLRFISTRNELFNKVEMITINLKSANDLVSPFDVDAIRGFSHLKYIYLKCEFTITESQIRAFIQNADPEISIFYKKIIRS